MKTNMINLFVEFGFQPLVDSFLFKTESHLSAKDF